MESEGGRALHTRFQYLKILVPHRGADTRTSVYLDPIVLTDQPLVLKIVGFNKMSSCTFKLRSN